MQEQMGAKRKLDEAMMDKVVGTFRTLPIIHFTREFVLDSQGGGWTGVLLLTDGKATFTQDQTTFMRVRSPRVATWLARRVGACPPRVYFFMIFSERRSRAQAGF